MPFYHIYEDKNPTHYGSTDHTLATNMMLDMADIYGLSGLRLVKEPDTHDSEAIMVSNGDAETVMSGERVRFQSRIGIKSTTIPN